MRKQQIKSLFEVAIEQRMSARFFNMLLAQLNKTMANSLRQLRRLGTMTEEAYTDRCINLITLELQIN